MTLHNATLVKRSDMDRISGMLRNTHAQTSEADELDRLRSLSEARAAKWPNTILANRRREEEEKRLDAEAEERRKQQIERVEAAERELLRQQQIDRANKMLFESSERVKSLHSKLLMSDIAAEREMQIEYKKQYTTLLKTRDRDFLEQQRQALAKAELEETAKQQKIKANLVEQQRIQLAQLDEVKAKILRERADSRREGDMIRQKAEEEAAAARIAEQERYERARASSLATKLANQALQEFKRLEKDRETAAERAIEQYAARKESLATMRAQKEAEKTAEKQAHRDRIAKQIQDHFTSIMEQEKSRVERDVAVAEQKAEEENQARRAAREAEWRAIDASRRAQLESKALSKAQRMEEDRKFAAQWSDRLQELKQEEEREKFGRFLRNKQHQAFLLRQAEQKQARRRAEQHDAFEEELLRKLAREQDDAVFADYAHACMAEYDAMGRSTAHLKSARGGGL